MADLWFDGASSPEQLRQGRTDATLVAARIEAVQLPPTQIKTFALSRSMRAKTDRIDPSLIARFMLFRPEAGRRLPSQNLRILRVLTTRKSQIVDMRKRLLAQIAARRKQDVPAGIEDMDKKLKAMLDTQVSDIEQRIENAIAQEESSAAKARLLRSIHGIGPVSAAMPIVEMPELGRMTAGEAADMTGLASVPYDSGTMRGKRMITGRRRPLRHVLLQAARAAACHNPVLKPIARRLEECGKPHKLVIAVIVSRLATIANGILKTGRP